MLGNARSAYGKQIQEDRATWAFVAVCFVGLGIGGVVLWQRDLAQAAGSTRTCAARYAPYATTDFFEMQFDFNDRDAKEELNVAHLETMVGETRAVFGGYDRVWPLTVMLTRDQPEGIQAWFGTWPQYGYCSLGIFLENDNDYMWRWHRTLMVHEYAHWFHYRVRDVADLRCLANMWARIDELSDPAKNVFVNNSYAATNIKEFYACAMEMYAARPDTYPNLAVDFGEEGHWASHNMFTYAELLGFSAGQDLVACLEHIKSEFGEYGT